MPQSDGQGGDTAKTIKPMVPPVPLQRFSHSGCANSVYATRARAIAIIRCASDQSP